MRQLPKRCTATAQNPCSSHLPSCVFRSSRSSASRPTPGGFWLTSPRIDPAFAGATGTSAGCVGPTVMLGLSVGQPKKVVPDEIAQQVLRVVRPLLARHRRRAVQRVPGHPEAIGQERPKPPGVPQEIPPPRREPVGRPPLLPLFRIGHA